MLKANVPAMVYAVWPQKNIQKAMYPGKPIAKYTKPTAVASQKMTVHAANK